MSLASSLAAASSSNKNIGSNPCVIGKLFVNDELSTEDKQTLRDTLLIEKNDPAYVSAPSLRLALRQEGVEVSVTAINDHRRGICRCFGLGR